MITAEEKANNGKLLEKKVRRMAYLAEHDFDYADEMMEIVSIHKSLGFTKDEMFAMIDKLQAEEVSNV